MPRPARHHGGQGCPDDPGTAGEVHVAHGFNLIGVPALGGHRPIEAGQKDDAIDLPRRIGGLADGCGIGDIHRQGH